MSIFVVLEGTKKGLRKVSKEVLSEGRRIANQVRTDLKAAILGYDIDGLIDDARSYGADKIVVAEHEELQFYQLEPYSQVLQDLIRQESPDVVIMGHTAMGRELAACLAEIFEAGLVSDCIAIEVSDKQFTYTRPLYAGKVLAKMTIDSAIQCITLRPNLFPIDEVEGKGAVVKISPAFHSSRVLVKERQADQTIRPELTEAEVVVSGGRGLGEANSFRLIEELADILNSAVGASRSAVDAGWRPQSDQVGQTGKIVNPKLYIAAGISGAVQHVVGMKGAKIILAINKDPDAPIFKVADYGIVGNFSEVIPELIDQLKPFERVREKEDIEKEKAEPISKPSASIEREIPKEEVTVERISPPGTLSDSQVNALVREMEAIVSKEYVSDSLFERIRNALDPFAYELEPEQVPYVVVLPESKEEISEILKYANSNRIPVFVRGSGTSMIGAARPHCSGIVINTRRLNKFEFLEDYGFVEFEAGCKCGAMEEELAKRGYFLPMEPGSILIATIGGLVCNNTSGHIIDTCIGKSGDYIYGVEAVLPTGEIIETGTMGMRRPAGSELTRLFVGGDGLYGVITRVRMRLLPMPEEACGVTVFKDLASAARGVQRMYLEGRPVPLLMEFMDRVTAQVGYEMKGLEPPAGPVVLFKCIGGTKDEAAWKMAQILECFRKEDPVDMGIIEDRELWKKLWTTRAVIGTYLMQKTGKQIISAEVVANLKDLVVCMDDVTHFNRGLPILGELPLYLLGHIGALTMHPAVLIPRDWDDETKKRAVRERVQREGELNLKYRTCPGELGQFSKRQPFFIQRYGEHAYRIAKGIKKAFDPNNILNPGVLEGYR